MPNFEALQHAIPVAPLRIAALEGCRDLADLVNQHLIEYRHENPSHFKDDILFKGYVEDSYLVNCSCPRFGHSRGIHVLSSCAGVLHTGMALQH